jgi:hypothetical protein
MLLVSSLYLITGDMSLSEFISSDSMTLLLEVMGISALRAVVKKWDNLMIINNIALVWPIKN